MHDLPNLRQAQSNETKPLNLKQMHVPRFAGKGTHSFINITSGGRIDFGGKQIMDEYDFENVENFGIFMNRDNPADATIYLIPNVSKMIIPLGWSKSNSPYIAIKPFLKTNKILHKDMVEYKVIKNYPWTDEVTNETIAKDIIKLNTSFGGEVESEPTKKHVVKETPKAAASAYDKSWTWDQKIRFFLQRAKKPLSSSEIMASVVAHEPKMDKKAIKSLSSMLIQGVARGVYKKGAKNEHGYYQYSLAK